jgi:homoserine O-acetyltransferase/O-succinyltransferase
MSNKKLMSVSTQTMMNQQVSPTSFRDRAADYPAPKEGSWIINDSRLHTGEVLPELRLHYTTVGAPTGEPVLILHGTNGLLKQR